MSVNSAELKFFTELEEYAKKNPSKPIEEQTLAEFRQGAGIFLEFAGEPADVSYNDAFISARDGHQIPIRIYNSDIGDNSPVLIMYPGCGYILDLFETNAIACSRIAAHSGIKVAIVNFRLAPEYPLPTAIYDGYDATKYIATHAKEFQIDPAKLFIGGISSGGHCAAVISHLARTDKEFNIFHRVLINGCYDLTQSTHDYDEYEKQDKLGNRSAATFLFKHYGITLNEYSNPLFSPYYEPDLANLPPTTFIIGEYDGIRNDSESYYARVKAAGNQVEKIILPGQTHNTIIMRKVLSDGEDPAMTVANVIKNKI